MLDAHCQVGVQGAVVAQTIDVSELADGLWDKLHHALLSTRWVESQSFQRCHGCHGATEHGNGRKEAVEKPHPGSVGGLDRRGG